MKRLLSLFVALIFFAGAVPTVFAAEPSDSAEPDAHLLVHYDFEGATVEEALTDKATGGSVQDSLYAYTPDNKNTDPSGETVAPTAVDSEAFWESFDVDIEQGTVRNLQAGAALEAISSEDIRSIYSRDENDNVGTATWFIRFRVERHGYEVHAGYLLWEPDDGGGVDSAEGDGLCLLPYRPAVGCSALSVRPV